MKPIKAGSFSAKFPAGAIIQPNSGTTDLTPIYEMITALGDRVAALETRLDFLTTYVEFNREVLGLHDNRIGALDGLPPSL
jgi:hypothetical protein